MNLERIAVVGGGIIGAAVARELTLKQPNAHITLIEKEQQLAHHQSGHNSGVVDAGLSYEPGSRNATLNRRGIELLTAYATQNGLPLKECGQLMIAQNTDEVERLDTIFANAKSSGIPGVRMLDRTTMRDVEPGARGVSALHSPHTAITDFRRVTESFARDLEAAGGRILFDSEVKRVDSLGNEARVRLALPGAQESTMTADGGAYDLVIMCAGLQADRLAVNSGLEEFPKIVPVAEDYFDLTGPATQAVRGVISAVPDPASLSSGVHLISTVTGELLVGPNTTLSLGREGYSRGLSDFKLGDVTSTLGFGGFWKFASKNLQSAARDARTTLSSRAYLEEAQKFVPNLDILSARPGRRGIRAQALNADGSPVDELVVVSRGRVTQVRNAPSSGATGAMAIAEQVVDQALAELA